MACVAMIRTIWRMRNQILFWRETFDEDVYFDMWWFDLAWWVKAKWGQHVSSMANNIWSPGYIELPRRPRKRKHHWVWSPWHLAKLRLILIALFWVDRVEGVSEACSKILMAECCFSLIRRFDRFGISCGDNGVKGRTSGGSNIAVAIVTLVCVRIWL